MNVFIGPYFNTNDSNISLDTVLALLSATGIVTKYLVRSHILVVAYSLPSTERGNGPTVSIRTVSKAVIGVCVTIIGAFVCVVTLARWHFS